MQNQSNKGLPLNNNKGFTKVNNEFLDSHHFTGVSPTAFRIYIMIRRFSNGLYKPCYPSQSLLAEKTGQSKDTIKRGVAELVEKGFLHAQKNRTGSNIYTFPLELSFEQGANMHGAGGKSAPSHESAKPPIARPPEKVSSGLGQGANLHPKQEVFNQQTNNKKEVCFNMTELPIYTAFKEIKRLSPDGLTVEAFTRQYNQALAKLVSDYSYDRAQEVEQSLGSPGAKGYQAKLISFARLLLYAYGQESLGAPHAFALSKFRANPQADKEYPSHFVLEHSDVIHARFYDNIKIDLALKRKQAIDTSKAQQLIAERQALASQAPPEIVKQAERRYNKEDYPGEMAGKVRQRLIEAEIVELMQKLKGVA